VREVLFRPRSSPELVERGIGPTNARKLASAHLLFIDRSSGRGKFRVTLATDLESGTTGATNRTAMIRIKKRLADLGKTDRASLGSARRERIDTRGVGLRWPVAVRSRVLSANLSRGALVVAHKKKRSGVHQRAAGSPHCVPSLHLRVRLLARTALRSGEDRKVVSFGKVTLSEAEKAAASALLGKTLKPPWSSGPPAYFADV
jgi:hypothetical protein